MAVVSAEQRGRSCVYAIALAHSQLGVGEDWPAVVLVPRVVPSLASSSTTSTSSAATTSATATTSSSVVASCHFALLVSV